MRASTITLNNAIWKATPAHMNHMLSLCTINILCLVCIFNSQFICLRHRLKLKNWHHRQGLLTSQQLAGKCATLREQQFHFAWGNVQCMLESLLPYATHALTAKLFNGNQYFTRMEVCCEYYSRAKSIRGNMVFYTKNNCRKLGDLCLYKILHL